MKKFVILLFLVPLTFQGCWWLFNHNNDYEFEFETIITDIPANLEGINSDRDDYNSDLPYRYQGATIFFSSNKPTYAGHFDIIRKSLEITYHFRKDNILNISYPGGYDQPSGYEKNVLQLINTDFNEYGPFTISPDNDYNYFFYASDEGGDLDIKYVFNPHNDYDGEQLSDIIEAVSLNSEYDDAYLTVDGKTPAILFCSNRENGQFDIYSAGTGSGTSLHYILSSASATISKVSVLSGSGNDKCPSVMENLLVFTSDRDGGYGGFDLYYSTFTDGAWSAPVNFGDAINTEYNEYRPVIVPMYTISEELMIFSSDRPGGKGGYDLYCVNIGDKAENPSWMNY